MKQISFVGLLLLGATRIAVAGSLDVSVVASDGKPVGDVAVFLEGSFAAPVQKTKATIVQMDREFNPYLTVIRTGTAVEFPNRDPFKHHVYSFSQPKIFEIKLYAGKPANPVVFDKPGAVALGCNIHDWMEAYVLVVDTPYFAKSEVDGWAHLKNIPAGEYTMKFWHPRQTAEVPARKIIIGDANQKISIQASVAPRPVYTKPPLGEAGY